QVRAVPAEGLLPPSSTWRAPEPVIRPAWFTRQDTVSKPIARERVLRGLPSPTPDPTAGSPRLPDSAGISPGAGDELAAAEFDSRSDVLCFSSFDPGQL